MHPTPPRASSPRAGRCSNARTTRPKPYRNPFEPRPRVPDAWDQLLVWLSSGTAVDPGIVAGAGRLTEGGAA